MPRDKHKKRGNQILASNKRSLKEFVVEFKKVAELEAQNLQQNTDNDAITVKIDDKSIKAVVNPIKDTLKELISKDTKLSFISSTSNKEVIKKEPYKDLEPVKNDTIESIEQSTQEPKLKTLREKVAGVTSTIKDTTKMMLMSEIPELQLLESAPETLKQLKEKGSKLKDDSVKIISEVGESLGFKKNDDTKNMDSANISAELDKVKSVNEDIKSEIAEQTKTLLEIEKSRELKQEELEIKRLREKDKSTKSSISNTNTLTDSTKSSSSEPSESSIFDLFDRKEEHKGSKRYSKRKGRFGKLGKLGRLAGKGIGKIGSIAGALLPSVAGAAEGSGAAASLLGTGAAAVSKAVPILAAGMALYSGVEGWNNASEIFGTKEENTTTGMKASAATGNILSNFSFGLIDEKEASKFIYEVGSNVHDSIKSTIDNVTETVSDTIKSTAGIFTNLADGVSSTVSSLYDSTKSAVSEFFGISESKAKTDSVNSTEDNSIVSTVGKTLLKASPIGVAAAVGSNLVDKVKSFFGFSSETSNTALNSSNVDNKTNTGAKIKPKVIKETTPLSKTKPTHNQTTNTKANAKYNNFDYSMDDLVSDDEEENKKWMAKGAPKARVLIQQTTYSKKPEEVKPNKVPVGKVLSDKANKLNTSRASTEYNKPNQNSEPKIYQPVTNNYYINNASNGHIENKGGIL